MRTMISINIKQLWPLARHAADSSEGHLFRFFSDLPIFVIDCTGPGTFPGLFPQRRNICEFRHLHKTSSQ